MAASPPHHRDLRPWCGCRQTHRIAAKGGVVMHDEGSVAGLATDDDLVRRSFQRRLPSDARVDPGLSPPPMPSHPERAVRRAVAVSPSHAIGRRPLVRETQSVDRFSIDASTVGIRKPCAATVSPVTAEVASARVAPPSGDRRESSVIEPASLVPRRGPSSTIALPRSSQSHRWRTPSTATRRQLLRSAFASEAPGRGQPSATPCSGTSPGRPVVQWRRRRDSAP